MSRQRYVYPTNEIAHLWIHQSQDNARNQTNNLYFYGNTIYSYGSHFPIAQIYDKDSHIVFMTTKTYSNTTSKHINYVQYAINHKQIFNVPNVEVNNIRDKNSHKGNLNHYFDLIEVLVGKHKRARKYSYKGEINQNLNELRLYIKLFKLRNFLTKDEKELVDNEDIIHILCDKKTNNSISFIDIRKRKEKNANARERKRQQKRLNDWLGFKLKFKTNKVYLRLNERYERIPLKISECNINNNRHGVQTSHGAWVSLKSAVILWKMIKTKKDVKGHKIDYYTVTSLNGTLKIGCHEIELEEVKRFGKLLDQIVK